MQPPSKRILRPTASLPTTAEHYGQQHGLPDDLQTALLNIGRKGRMSVAQGRTFDRTQSYPSFTTTSLNPTPDIPEYDPSGFMTSQQTLQHAQSLIHKDGLRQFKNELKPYSDLTSSSGRGRAAGSESPERGGVSGGGRRLRFGNEGVSFDDGPGGPGGRGGNGVGQSTRDRRREKLQLTPSKKRRNEDDEHVNGNVDGSDQVNGSETETSDIEVEQEDDGDDVENINPGLAGASSSTNDDFPAVFASPGITQPELFARPAARGIPARKTGAGRQVRGLPGSGGRSLGKAVSAPVGGLWGGGGAAGGMDVDGEAEDGFDVSEWANSENF